MYEDKIISVVIPAYNEEAKIGDTIDSLPRYIDHVIVVDDGSVDRTAAIARERGVTLCSHPRNRGVGAAFNTGRNMVLSSEADIMVNIDGDGQFNPADIEKLIRPIIEGRADFVTASRFKDPQLYPRMSRVKFQGNRFMSWMISRMTGRRFYDVSCGFRAYSRKALLHLNLFSDFTYTQETFLDFVFKNISILEVPVAVRGTREFGKSRVASNLFRYAYQTLKIIIRTLRDYKPFRLFASIALIFLLTGLFPAVFLAVHYIRTGTFSPHKWAGFTAAFLFTFSALSFVLGFILDMFARMRMNQEEILVYLKKRK
ncbi:MAG: glycosyltransferase family 2 protein [Candidatus Krumholzibacteriota bacterium]|nr:glycosyltransferase family 2 protein [Candidatus Krumholzibacteriota bacterium]